ncbi:MAG TPA: bifunctional sulfate adenylyltransferase/adenylylsulfate kinase [Dokdonella sp.]|uniref:bifunctional sulfate adenylyltransferase/adenylylsulfate kinase n=2 Tax=Dokdonella sp. TaxID=2291710 RepID=UPI002B9D5AF0|nr:bifunctional sulfate adenylyltransferase/adenylylsulfate kinase [Dokdonella sp.]HOX70316.1 bifunctional sulfate adenylyltransferase/adenylylsulfate kinase [Dokdonella sp.]HPG94725.1 bifunctional sulfate adenylyltransferase/adenylylsulfate kinase [Dokdonella sp.]
MSQLIAPHGGHLVDGLVSADEAARLKRLAGSLPSWDLTPRQLCDLEMLLTGAFSPLDGFMTRRDYEPVRDNLRLADGNLWPMPITLDVDQKFSDSIGDARQIALRDPEGVVLAILDVEDRWEADRALEAQQVFGTTDRKHPSVSHLLERSHPIYVGGKLHGLELPRHYDFGHLRSTPAELRAQFTKLGWTRVVAFQTRNPMHRAHVELTFRAAQIAEANLLIQPVVGLTKPGDIDHYTRVRCYEKLLRHYPERTTTLALLHLAMRMGGPREALWHAIIRKNHGCTHFIVGRDHAGPGNDSSGKPFYGPYDAQALVAGHQAELGITMVPFQEMVYVQERAQYMPADEVKEGDSVLNISGTELRRRLQEGLDIPEWFTYPEVIEELRRTHPARHKQGFTVFFTGLSGSGKSTIANALLVRLLELGTRPVTLLDGDIVRKNLSSELGFSKEHRDLNVQRIGFVAAEITKNGGIAICAPIAPYKGSRDIVRENVSAGGVFVEIHVSTPIETCEGRDRKGLYALARAGKIKEFTGISDPYEVPENPDLRIDTTAIPPDQAVQQIVLKLEALGLIRPAQ